LFADVELASTNEASALEVMGLEIEGDEGDGVQLLQPCAALKGKRCAVYAHRPDCCRSFECRLLQETKRGVVSVEEARAKIAEALGLIGRVKRLIGHLGGGDDRLPLKERCVEALGLSAEGRGDLESNRKRKELEAAMAGVERLIQKSFLKG